MKNTKPLNKQNLTKYGKPVGPPQKGFTRPTKPAIPSKVKYHKAIDDLVLALEKGVWLTTAKGAKWSFKIKEMTFNDSKVKLKKKIK